MKAGCEQSGTSFARDQVVHAAIIHDAAGSGCARVVRAAIIHAACTIKKRNNRHNESRHASKIYGSTNLLVGFWTIA